MNNSDRRLEVAEAAWRVIIREGLNRTSMRAIAQELGSTTGVVTHHFRNKDELMLFAFERVIQKTINQMQTSMKGLTGLDRLEQMILAPLPLQSGDEVGWKIWVAFLGQAIGHEYLIKEHQHRYAQICEIIIKELKDLQIAKLIRADIDLQLEATALIALIDGIGTGFVVNSINFSPQQQKYLVQRYIYSLLLD